MINHHYSCVMFAVSLMGSAPPHLSTDEGSTLHPTIPVKTSLVIALKNSKSHAIMRKVQ